MFICSKGWQMYIFKYKINYVLEQRLFLGVCINMQKAAYQG